MTLDTNIVIAYLAGEESVVDLLTQWRKAGQPLFLSAIVETEVLSFSGWMDSERGIAENFLEENFTTIAFDRAVARIAAGIRRQKKIKFPDAAIAATAISTHTALVTRNTKDFKGIEELEFITI